MDRRCACRSADAKLAVDMFNERVMSDDRINHFFVDVDMDRQRERQRAFPTYAFGGTDQYDGRYRHEAYGELVAQQGLNHQHFEAVTEDLMLSLNEMGVSEELRAKVAAIAAAPQHKKDVLNQ